MNPNLHLAPDRSVIDTFQDLSESDVVLTGGTCFAILTLEGLRLLYAQETMLEQSIGYCFSRL